MRDLLPLRAFLGADTLHGAGRIAGSLRGRIDSLQLAAALQMHELLYNRHAADSLSARLQARWQAGGPVGNAALQFFGIRSAGLVIDSVGVQAGFTPRQVQLALDAVRDASGGHLLAEVHLDSTIKIVVPEMALTYRGRRWQGGSPDMWIAIDSSRYRIHNFHLSAANDTTRRPAQLYIDGVLEGQSPGNYNASLAYDRGYTMLGSRDIGGAEGWPSS